MQSTLHQSLSPTDIVHLSRPTPQAYEDWQRAFDFFNNALWEGRLPDCVITLRNKARSFGYFSRQRFINHRGTLVDEIAINPGYLAVRPIEISISTLVHEMCHSWQEHFGNPTRRGYHNMEWAQEMERIGLMPSHTGLPGGRRTGQAITHYIAQGGLFDTLSKELIQSGFTITWMDRVLAVAPGDYQLYLTKLGSSLFTEGEEPEGEEEEGDVSEGDIPPPPADDGSQVNPGHAPAGTITAAEISSSRPQEPVTAPSPSAPALKQKAPLSIPMVPVSVIPADKIKEQEMKLGEDVLMAPSPKGSGLANKSNREKFVCQDCSAAAWGKPTLKLICGECNTPMLATA